MKYNYKNHKIIIKFNLYRNSQIVSQINSGLAALMYSKVDILSV